MTHTNQFLLTPKYLRGYDIMPIPRAFFKLVNPSLIKAMVGVHKVMVSQN